MNSIQQRVIAITSGKGGVGKTLLTACLGTILSEQLNLNGKVLLVDFDFGVKGLTFLYGSVEQWKDFKSMSDFFKGTSPSDILKHSRKVKISKNPYAEFKGISSRDTYVTLIPSHLDFKKSIAWEDWFADSGNTGRNINNFIKVAQKSGFDIILFDTGAGIDKSLLSLAKHVDKVIVVVEPDEVSLTSALDLRGELVKLSEDLSFVVNKTPDATFDIQAEKIKEIHFLPRLPFDTKLHVRFVKNARVLARTGFARLRYKRFVGKIATELFNIKFKQPTLWDVLVVQKTVKFVIRLIGYGLLFSLLFTATMILILL